MTERLSPDERARLTYKIERRIDRFADLMKARMHAKINKGDWADDPPAGTALRLMSHIGDLAADLMGDGVGGDLGRLNRCLNVANFAFILADNLVGHLFPEPEQETSDED